MLIELPYRLHILPFLAFAFYSIQVHYSLSYLVCACVSLRSLRAKTFNVNATKCYASICCPPATIVVALGTVYAQQHWSPLVYLRIRLCRNFEPPTETNESTDVKMTLTSCLSHTHRSGL